MACGISLASAKCAVFFNKPVDLGPVIEIISQGRVDIAKRQVVLGRDLIRALAHSFVPNGDVLNPNAMPGDARLTAVNPRCDFDVTVERLGVHSESRVGERRNLRIIYPVNRRHALFNGFIGRRWLIQDQMKSDRAFADSPGGGLYLWANGTNAGKPGRLVWKREDIATDGVHPTMVGPREGCETAVGVFRD